MTHRRIQGPYCRAKVSYQCAEGVNEKKVYRQDSDCVSCKLDNFSQSLHDEPAAIDMQACGPANNNLID